MTVPAIPTVLAYFADDPTRSYQLIQWLPALEVLDRTQPVAIVTRHPETEALIRTRTTLPVLFAPSFPELTALYGALDAAVVLYCNNSMLNFQSLLDNTKLHVHINHGESDKQSMASNNAKAYDRVFVAGQAAVDRHAAGLLEFDLAKLVRIGRPQLDLRLEPLVVPSARRTVLYAPTWEGDADYNDYTSVDVFGPAIARAILGLPGLRMVYKPHPQLANSKRPAVRAGHAAVLAMVEDAARREPDAGHQSISVGDILAVMPECDAMITDVSSVGLDWLYLRTECPIFITDRHDDSERLRQEVPVSRCADVLNAHNIDDLDRLLVSRLTHDEHHLARVAMRHHYFDEVQVGESTARFVEEVTALIALHERLTGRSVGAGAAITA